MRAMVDAVFPVVKNGVEGRVRPTGPDRGWAKPSSSAAAWALLKARS
jgi:hypothetical protein